jgi:putative membrane-bound dehydrogenase-like protein
MNFIRLLAVAPLLFGLAASQETSGPLSPKEALKTFTVAKGFRIELVAAEPDLLDPVAMAFDEDGRIYVAEMIDYPLGPPAGRIMRFEDGRATVFAEKIPYPTGVMPWRGGVLVTAAPDILFLKDTDGDGRADVREVVFTGFVEGNQQHRVNGLQFGLDNWIIGTNGDSGGNIRRGNVDGPKISISGRDYRFRPDYSGFEGVAGRGQFSNTFDDWGNRFINDNSNHIRHPVLPLKYLARNPNLAVAAVEEGISDHGGSSQVFPTSKLQERPNDHFAAGRFTSACSVTIYRGAAFGPEFQGNAFTCEPVHNLVHRDVVVSKGASFVAKRGEEKSEFLSSTDNWCRPVNLCGGPDGALYVLDMYRAVIEHPQWIPLEMQKRVNLRAGSDMGRMYRIVPDGWKPGPPPRMSKQSAAELVAHFENPNAWWRATAQRLLIERQDKSAVDPLRKMAAAASPLARLHALWTLEGLGALEDGTILAALKDADPGIREQGLRLAESRIAGSKAMAESILAMAGETSPRVRFQLAFTLGYLEGPAALEMLAAIVIRDIDDKWTRLAALSSVKDLSSRLLSKIPADVLDKGAPSTLDLVRQLGELAGSSRDEAQIVEWLQALTVGSSAPTRWRLVALSALGPAIRRGGLKLDALLTKSGTTEKIGEWKAGLLETAVDSGREVADRVSAMEMLSLMPLPEMASAMEKLLQPKEPPQVQVAAVRALGTDAAARLLDGWARYTAPVRREVLAACLAKPGTTEGVVDRLEKGEIRVVELEPHQKEALLKHPSGGVRERVKKALASKSDDREQVIQEIWAKVEKLKGDPVAGEKVYMTSCSTCHRLNGQGYEVGASLSSVAGREKRALLTDILDPNRAVAPQYQVYLVKIPNARDPVSGIIAAETPTSITLRRANAEETVVLRRDILEIKAYTASLMPEGIEANVTAQNFADLLEFLQRGPAK